MLLSWGNNVYVYEEAKEEKEEKRNEGLREEREIHESSWSHSKLWLSRRLAG